MGDSDEILILAVTRMRGGVCVAGMTRELDPASGLRWVRPVKPHGLLLLGDIRYADGALMQPGMPGGCYCCCAASACRRRISDSGSAPA